MLVSEKTDKLSRLTAARTYAMVLVNDKKPDFTKAKQLLDQSASLIKASESIIWRAVHDYYYGELYLAQKKYTKAKKHLNQAEKMFKTMKMDWWQAETQKKLAELSKKMPKGKVALGGL